MSALALDVQAVTAGYVPEVDILRGISVQVREREIVTVLGPNGAGKSTLIKAIAGLVPVRSGSIRFFGDELLDVPAHRLAAHGLAYVPQTGNVFVRLSVQENLEIGAAGAGRDRRRTLQEDFDRVYELFPRLEERRRQAAGTLSGGERQMVAVARALMSQPRVLMLDEPSAGLSQRFVGLLFARIREVRALGVTILIVEQNARTALAISDRGYVLAEGSERIEGAAESLLGNPEVGALYLGAQRALA